MTYQIPENAIIQSIKEDTIVDNSRGWRESYEGLIIETDKGSIKLVISDSQSCCEQWGALFLKPQMMFLNLLELKFYKLKILILKEKNS